MKKLLLALLPTLLFVQPTLADTEDPVFRALCPRHGVAGSVEDLVAMAGGEDQLVEKLLKYRILESPPFVGIRAEKLLLEFAGRDDVRAVLESDVQSEQYLGLARLITLNIDSVSNAETRRSLARLVLNQSANNSSLRIAAKNLRHSKDAQISSLARESLD